MSIEKPSEIKYSSPKESREQGEAPQHRFDVLVDGKKIGAAEVDYFSKPVPLYQVTELYVDFEHKGKGHASKILEQIEKFLDNKKKPGVLVDAIISGDPAQGMYARRGWKEVPGSMGMHVYNWPEDASLEALAGYAFRYTDPMTRGSEIGRDAATHS